MTENRKAAVSEIIVVDDEPDIRDMVQEYLLNSGFAVRTADSGDALDALIKTRPADLILLDLNLGTDDGLSIARRLRATIPTLAIIMLTALGETVDRVIGLEVGADDYIAKPFDLREVRARIRSVLRRRGVIKEAEQGDQVPNGRMVSFGQKSLDLERHCLVDRQGQEERLTAMEFDLLRAFANAPNRVLSRDQLLELAHQRGSDPFDRSIDIRIARIRRKIELQSDKPQIIKTVRGSGYIFIPPKAGNVSV